MVAPEKVKLDFIISTAKWILWFKTIPGKSLQTTEQTTKIWEFWCLCKSFSNVYWIAGGFFINIPTQLIHFKGTFVAWFQNVFKNFTFLWFDYKKEMEDSIHFLAQEIELLNKQDSLNSYYSTYFHLFEGFLGTTTTTQEVSFHQCVIK